MRRLSLLFLFLCLVADATTPPQVINTTCPPSQWITAIVPGQMPTCIQPNYSDLSGSAPSQLPSPVPSGYVLGATGTGYQLVPPLPGPSGSPGPQGSPGPSGSPGPQGIPTIITGIAPIVIAGPSPNPTISITQSGEFSDGYLSSFDWNLFDQKQSPLPSPTPSGDVLTAIGSSFIWASIPSQLPYPLPSPTPSGYYLTSTGTGVAFTALPTCVRVAVTSSATLATTTCIEAVTSTASPVTITLPAASSAIPGVIYYIKDESCLASVNNISMTRAGSDTIDDAQTSIVVTANCGSITFYSNGVSKWFTL